MPADRHAKGASPELRALGRLIVYLRMDAGVSQKDLAKAIRTSGSQLSKWERAKVELRVRSREKVAAAFDLDRNSLEELAQRLARSVARHLARLRSSVAEPTSEAEPTHETETDAADLRALIEAVRLRRRDLEAERAEIDEAIRAANREEDSLHFQLGRLRKS